MMPHTFGEFAERCALHKAGAEVLGDQGDVEMFAEAERHARLLDKIAQWVEEQWPHDSTPDRCGDDEAPLQDQGERRDASPSANLVSRSSEHECRVHAAVRGLGNRRPMESKVREARRREQTERSDTEHPTTSEISGAAAMKLKNEFKDRDYRKAYAESFANTIIATQIRLLRGSMSQEDFADLVGVKQSRISAMEDENYAAWSTRMLKRIAAAKDVVFLGRYVTFGELLDWARRLSEADLTVSPYDDDPAFQETSPGRLAAESRP
jgi:DNA-binding transcriptional regulator YiaG